MAANFRAQHDRDDDEIRSLRAKLEAQKNHLSVVYTTLLIIDFIQLFPW